MDSNADNEAPTVVCPTNETIEADDNQSTAVMIWNALATTDNSKLIPTVTCNTENGSQFEIGETEVICQASDQAGNQAACSFTIDVKGQLHEFIQILIHLYAVQLELNAFP